MPALPNTIALTNIAPGADILSADHRNNYSAIQTAVNGIIGVLGVTAKGSILVATAAGTIAELVVGADGKILVADSTQASGAKWAGGMTLIADQLLVGAQASFDTNTILGGNIPSSFAHLRMVLVARSNQAAVTDSLLVRLNNDSGANYFRQLLQGVGAAASGGETGGANDANGLVNATIPAATALAGSCAIVAVDIPNFAGATFHKMAMSTVNFRTALAAGGESSQLWAGGWSNAAAITRLACSLVSGSFAAGSRFSLYGLS